MSVDFNRLLDDLRTIRRLANGVLPEVASIAADAIKDAGHKLAKLKALPAVINRVPLAAREEAYVWRECVKDSSGDPRLLIPHSDPQRYENAMDWLFASPEEAQKNLSEGTGTEYADETLVLCRQILVPVAVFSLKANDDEDGVVFNSVK